MTSQTDPQLALQFLVGLFGETTTDPVFLCSLPNDKGDAGEQGERHLLSRDPAQIAAFAQKWDRARRALYYCVGTLVPDAAPDKPGGSKRLRANVSELAFIHTDIDSKSIQGGDVDPVAALDAALHAIEQRLELKPSVIVGSGNGLHCYWLLKEGILAGDPDLDRAEGIMRQLADLLAGDLPVAHRAALMRLPGSHNTKAGTWKPVTVLKADYGLRYGLDEIEDLVSNRAPLVLRLATGGSDSRLSPNPAGANPYLAVAARLGHKPPIDVEQRLAGMRLGAGGGASVHETQVSVTASMLSRGVALEDVVTMVLDATRAAAGELGDRWNWSREERAIRRMSEDWLRKNPVVERATPAPPAAAPATDTPPPGPVGPSPVVVDFKQEKAKRQSSAQPKPKAAAAPKVPKGPPAHVILSISMIKVAADAGAPFMSLREDDGSRRLYRYDDGLWSEAVSLDLETEVAARALSIETSIKIRNETFAAIKASPDTVVDASGVAWDDHGLVPCANGLLDVATGDITAYTPEHHATWRLPHDYDPSAGCPKWEQALRDFFRDKIGLDVQTQYRLLVQEVFGASLLTLKPRALARATAFYGDSNSGKSQIIDVFVALHGKSPITQDLSDLGGTHGTAPFIRHAPWVLHEAFKQGRWVSSDKMKTLITQEPLIANPKFGQPRTIVFRGPILWATNYPPTVQDSTTAVSNRMLVVPVGAGFSDKDPTGIALEARTAGFDSLAAYIMDIEAPGVLAWAVAGLRSLRARGKFAVPEEMEHLQQDIRDDANPVSEFVRDCCEFDPDRMVNRVDLVATYRAWWSHHHGEDRRSPSSKTITIAIKALGDKRIGTDKEAFHDNHARYYGGISLNPNGMDFWVAAEASASATGHGVGMSKDRQSVNMRLPIAWHSKPEVQQMIAAHRKFEKASKAGSGSNAGDTSDPGHVTHDRGSEPRF